MMRTTYVLPLILTYFLISMLSNITIIAQEIPETTPIKEYEEDVTGDGIKENIKLYGTLLTLESNYYKDLYATIKTKSNQKWKVQLKGVYEPNIEFFDLTHSGVNDMLFKGLSEEDTDSYYNSLHTIKNNEVIDLDLPSTEINGRFINDFQAELFLTPHSKPIILDLSKQKNEYTRLNIFNNKGQLLKERKLIINPITSYKPFLISSSKGYGVKSLQKIKGAHHEDNLGSIETIWYFEKDKWIILQTEWKPRM